MSGGEAAAGPPSARWRALFWLATLASALPVFATRHLPFTDLPEHVAAMATLARLLPGGGGAPYEIALGQSQYLVYHASGALLTRVVGDAVLANQLLLFATAVAWPVSLRALLRALGRDERVAIFASVLFWNRALAVGFLPFVAAVPVAVYALSLVVRQLGAPSARRLVALGALAIAVFYTHVSAYVVLLLAGAAMVLALRPPLRTAGALVLGFAPSGLAAIVWWRAGSLGGPAGQDSLRMPIGDSVAAMPLWSFDIWRSHVDEACAAVWWGAFAVLLALGLRRAGAVDRRTLAAAAPFAVVAVLYVVSPFSVGAAGYLNLRLAPVLALFGLLWLRPGSGRVASASLLAVVAASLVGAGNVAFEARRAEREHLGQFDELVDKVRPDKRLALLNFEQRSPRTIFWPYVYAGSYARARRGGLTAFSFAEFPHWSVHYASGSKPPWRGPHWIFTPCVYRYREDGGFYDYVLVQGEVDPFPSDAPGPRFVPVARQGRFTLYGKAEALEREGARSGGEPTSTANGPGDDPGPCPFELPPPAP